MGQLSVILFVLSFIFFSLETVLSDPDADEERYRVLRVVSFFLFVAYLLLAFNPL